MKNHNYKIFIFLLVIFSVSPLIISSNLGINDPFIHQKIASIILVSNEKYIDISSTQFEATPAFGFLIIILSKISAMSPEFIEYFPIAGILFLIISYNFAKKITTNTLLALMLTGILIFKWVSPIIYSVWPHSFGYALYLLFISTFINLGKNKKFEILIVLWIIFIGVHLFSYNAEIWIIFFVLFANLLMIINQATTKKKQQTIISFFLSFIVIFFGFNQIIYSTYFPKLINMSDEISLTGTYYLSLIFRTVPPGDYLYMRPPSPPHLLFLNTTWFIFISLPIIVLIIYILINSLRHKFFKNLNHSISFDLIIYISIFLVWLVDIFVYVPIGAITVAFTRYFTFIGPLFATISLKYILEKTNIEVIKTKISRVLFVYVSIIFILSILIFILTLSQGFYITSPSKYTEIHPSANWFFNHTEKNYIFSDHHTQGQYAIIAAKSRLFFNPQNLYTPESYKNLVDANISKVPNSYFRGEYVIINFKLADKETSAGGWRNFEPINKHIQKIDFNINLNKVYNDGSIYIYKG
ncbi:Uncharacterised protein [uncultured archaeon]|nr:Uncharacterised protein [uncultured archaeon]